MLPPELIVPLGRPDATRIEPVVTAPDVVVAAGIVPARVMAEANARCPAIEPRLVPTSSYESFTGTRLPIPPSFSIDEVGEVAHILRADEGTSELENVNVTVAANELPALEAEIAGGRYRRVEQVKRTHLGQCVDFGLVELRLPPMRIANLYPEGGALRGALGVRAVPVGEKAARYRRVGPPARSPSGAHHCQSLFEAAV
jgi:hypothetical protein